MSVEHNADMKSTITGTYLLWQRLVIPELCVASLDPQLPEDLIHHVAGFSGPLLLNFTLEPQATLLVVSFLAFRHLVRRRKAPPDLQRWQFL